MYCFLFVCFSWSTIAVLKKNFLSSEQHWNGLSCVGSWGTPPLEVCKQQLTFLSRWGVEHMSPSKPVGFGPLGAQAVIVRGLQIHIYVYIYIFSTHQFYYYFQMDGLSFYRLFFSALLRYNWQNCDIFKVYIVMVWYTDTLWKDSSHLVN